jgi:hypothetical protein
MSYIVPSVLVYQQLENAGGVANSTPDLEACVFGPAYNVLRYTAGSTISLVKTAATSATSALGSVVAGSKNLTFVNLPPFSIGDSLIIVGATSDGGTLAAKVESAAGVVLTLDTAAGKTLTGIPVTKQGTIVNSDINNTFALPGQKPGQVIDATSIQVFVNQAKIETLSTGFNGYVGSNNLTISAASGIGSIVAASNSLTAVSNPTLYSEGETITVAGAGVAAGLLTAKILVIAGSVFTLSAPATTTSPAAAVTKIAQSNVSSTTNTLMVEAGDEVDVSYVDTNAIARNLVTTVTKVISATGTITNVTLADVLPAGSSAATTSTAAISAGAAGCTLASAAGFAIGDVVIIRGAGAGGADHEATIGGLAGATVSGLNPITITATTGPVAIIKRTKVVFRTRKLFNNQLVPVTKPISGGANYNTSSTATDGHITLNAGTEIIYGTVKSGSVHIAYKALRTDLSGEIMAIANPDDNLGIFGEISEDNPLALGVSIALANTTTRVRAIAVSSNDAQGYADALDMSEGERVYALAPLTQDASILQMFNLHAQALSTPEEALWRVAYVNTKIPTKVSIGSYTADLVNANGGNNSISILAGKYVLTSSNSTFISDNVTPGDTLNVTAGTGAPSPIGTMQVLEIISNQQVVVEASGVATGISFYITRTLSKTQRAAAVAANSRVFGSNRLVHVQPDTVLVNVGGRNVVQPGYFLCCALAGLTAGFPSQQGFTNIAIAGITDIYNSNFTFTRAQLNTMAEAGTLLFVQETAGGLPYVRHELTTDMTVYEYRELMAVKNWDFLSYFYHDKLKGFIGKWNITPDTIGIIRQTIDASSELIKAKKLPRIGAPLIDAKIQLLEQDANNKDNLNVRLKIQQPSTLNYLNMYLVI